MSGLLKRRRSTVKSVCLTQSAHKSDLQQMGKNRCVIRELYQEVEEVLRDVYEYVVRVPDPVVDCPRVDADAGVAEVDGPGDVRREEEEDEEDKEQPRGRGCR